MAKLAKIFSWRKFPHIYGNVRILLWYFHSSKLVSLGNAIVNYRYVLDIYSDMLC